MMTFENPQYLEGIYIRLPNKITRTSHFFHCLIRLCCFCDQTVAVLYRAGVTHGVWPFDWVSHYELHQVEDGVSVERRRPRVEFIEDAAQRPEISSVVIRLLLHQLRRHVQWSSLDRSQHQGGDAHGPGKPSERLHHM